MTRTDHARIAQTCLQLGKPRWLAGLAGLFRYDLGIDDCVFSVLAIGAIRYSVAGATWLQIALYDTILFIAGCFVILGLYTAWIRVRRDAKHLTMLMRSIYNGMTDTVYYYDIVLI